MEMSELDSHSNNEVKCELVSPSARSPMPDDMYGSIGFHRNAGDTLEYV
jgi:hypothetical protein